MKRCGNCGASVKDDMQFCTTCGHRFSEEKQNVCSNCGSELKEGTKFCMTCGHQLQEEKQNICSNCGVALKDGMKFCVACGTPVTEMRKAEKPEEQVEEERFEESEEYIFEEEFPEKKSHKGLVALLVSLLILLIVSVAAAAILIWQNNQETDSKDEESKQEERAEDEQEEKKKKKDKNKEKEDEEVDEEEVVEEITVSRQEVVEEVVETYISDNGITGDVSVAIFDNLTGEQYVKSRRGDTYTAWGLYLPIYLAYGETDYYDLDVRDDILSSDPAKCNASANAAIEDMGGFYELNQMLEDYYDSSATTYGRMFGDTTATSDNYTTATDAVLFLSQLDAEGGYRKLGYDLNAFGISAPENASVYAHVGTENRNVKDQLNLFAIVKGENSDYCVAILTRNANSGYITELLDTIHEEMEAEL